MMTFPASLDVAISVSDVTLDTERFLKKLGFPGGCGLASAPNVFQKLWRRAFDLNRMQFGIK